MALAKAVELPTGVTAQYWRITAFTGYLGNYEENGDPAELRTTVMLGGYLDQTTRQSGKQPITEHAISFFGLQVAQALAAADALPSGGVYDRLRTVLYLAIKQLPAWADATDV